MLTAIQTKISQCHMSCDGRPGFMLLDTPLGINDPARSGTLQSIAYRPLRLPIILVGNSDVSSLISAYESCRIRGYNVVAILIEDTNETALEVIEQNVDSSVIVECFPTAPTSLKSPLTNDDSVESSANYGDKWFETMGDIGDEIMAELITGHCRRVQDLSDLAERGRRRLWWANTQHFGLERVLAIESQLDQGIVSYEPHQKTETQQSRNSSTTGTATYWLDATAGGSMTWTSANHRLALSLASAVSRYGSTPLAGSTTEPAVVLAEKLVWTVGKQWSARVFYTDSGKDAMEVAIKIGIRYYETMNKEERWTRDESWSGIWEVIGIVGGGTGDAAAPSVVNRRDNWYANRRVLDCFL